MQKLPEAPDRKKGGAYSKEGTFSAKERSLFSLSAVTSEVTTPKSFLLQVEGPCVRLLTMRWLTFPLVAAASFTNDPQLKTPNNGLVRITIKTPYNGLND